MRTKIGCDTDGEYCKSDGFEGDVYLGGFSRPNKIKLMGAFAVALREGRYSRQSDGPLAEGTVRSAISYVSLSFRENDRPNPTKDEDGDLGRVLSRLFRAFRNKDPNPKQQKALPAQVLVMMYKRQETESEKAIAQLGLELSFG